MIHMFAAAYDTAGIRISTVKTDMLHVSRNTKRLLQLNGATQKQLYKFKFIKVAFTVTQGKAKNQVSQLARQSQ